MSASILPGALRPWVTECFGPVQRAEPLGSAGAAFGLVGPDGRRAVLKTHRQSGKYQRERAAYVRWAPQLPVRTAALVAERREPLALLLSALPGRDAVGAGLAPEHEQALHRQAGQALAALHRLASTAGDPMPLDEAYALRLAALLRRHPDRWPRLATHLGAGLARVRPQLQRMLRVPCHRDFEPRNWRVFVEQGRVTLGVLDFEHAREDLFLQDFVRLAGLVWPARGDLEDSFWDGYGRRLVPEEQVLLQWLLELEAVATLGWGLEHDDAEFIGKGERMLTELGLDGLL